MPERAEPLRLAVIGASPRVSGVLDHAQILTAELAEEGVDAQTHWLLREGESAEQARRRMGEWSAELRRDLAHERPQAILLHYSVFSFSHKGLPLFVRQVLGALAGQRVPIVTVLHEFAYPWGLDGARGAVWGVTQRFALRRVMRASAAVALTTDSRERWISSRVWLPRRASIVAPVFSNLPPPRPAAPREAPTVGVFGYSYGAKVVALVLEALAARRNAGEEPELLLAGAPGKDSAVGEQWLRGASERGLRAPLFSGRVELQTLSDLLASCELLLNADPNGPSSRKTTLAAALASGRPVLALDGPESWERLRAAGAARIVAPDPGTLAAELAALLDDAGARDSLGARGRAFAAAEMNARSSARALAAILRDSLSASARARGG